MRRLPNNPWPRWAQYFRFPSPPAPPPWPTGAERRLRQPVPGPASGRRHGGARRRVPPHERVPHQRAELQAAPQPHAGGGPGQAGCFVRVPRNQWRGHLTDVQTIPPLSTGVPAGADGRRDPVHVPHPVLGAPCPLIQMLASKWGVLSPLQHVMLKSEKVRATQPNGMQHNTTQHNYLTKDDEHEDGKEKGNERA